MFGSGDEDFYQPAGITTDRDGNVYVVDSQHWQIKKFTSDGTFLRKWEVSGEGGQPSCLPWAVAVDAQGIVCVALQPGSIPCAPFGILRFSSSGDLLDTLNIGVHELCLASDEQGRVVGAARRVLHPQPGTTLYHYAIYTFSPSEPIAPTLELPSFDRNPYWSLDAMGIDPWGNMFLAGSASAPDSSSPWLADVVWKVSPEHAPLDQPLGICIDRDDNIYVTDFRKHRVVKYAYGEK